MSAPNRELTAEADRLKDSVHRDEVARAEQRLRIEQLEEQDRLRRAIDRLPAAQREVVIKRLAEDCSFAEIAAELGVPLGTVLSRMRLAIEKLRADFDS